jgi:hypothetical protein
VDNSTFSPFTASELALVHGDQLAPKGGLLNKTKVIGTENEVSTNALAEAVLTSAFLFAEKCGAIKLEVRTRKALLGLRSVETLYADPTNTPGEWPAATVEGALVAQARRLAPKTQNDIQNIVYQMLAKDVAAPFAYVLDLVQQGLAARQLLNQVEERKLKIFVTHHFEMPESTRSAVQRQPAEPLRQMLAADQQSRPALHKLLVDAVNKGIKNRTEQTDTTRTD